MMPNAASLSTWRLYVIVDAGTAGTRDLVRLTDQAIRGGADAIQFRAKQASTKTLLREAARLLEVTQSARIPLIINDRVDIAAAVGASGVHLGQDDLPIAAARRLLGPQKIIGKSTHSLAEATAASREGADYLAVGPIYPTPTKPEYPCVGLGLIGQVKQHVRTPIVVIGGVDRDRLPEVLMAGAACVAVVRAVCGADDPEAAARTLKQTLTQFVRATHASPL